jgi:hypothetical protein
VPCIGGGTGGVEHVCISTMPPMAPAAPAAAVD